MKTHTILLIGGDDALRHTVNESLKSDGITLLNAPTHDDALSQYHQGNPIHLILLDLQEGLAVDFMILKTLHRQMPSSPIILIGCIDDEQALNRTFDYGVVDVMETPLRPVLIRQRIHHFLTLQDITRERERLQLAMEGADDGLWDWNMVTGYTFFNPRWAEMLGYWQEELAPSVDTWRELIHPEDMPYVEAKLLAHIEHNDVYEIEHRLLTKSGEWKWIRASGKVVEWGENNTPLRMTGIHNDIDQRKRMEEMLRDNQSRLRMLIENVTDIIYSVSFEGIITYSSPNWMEYLGHPVEDVLEKPISEFIHPEDRSIYETFLQEVMETGEKQLGVEFRIRNQQGHWVWFTSTASLAKSETGAPVYFVGAMHDITHHQQVKETLADTERRYRIISNTISDYAYSYRVNPDNTLTKTWSTEAFHKITGYSFQEMDDSGWLRIIHPDDLPIAQRRFEKLLQGEIDVSEFRVITKDGNIRWLVDHAYPVKDENNGHITYIYGAAQDITNRKRTEEKLQEQAEELRARNEELDAFAYTVAHDLKNPISSMMGFASLILSYYDRMPDEQVLEYVELVLEGGYKLKSIINALLLLAGVGKIEQPQMEPLDMADIIAQVQRRLADMNKEYKAQIRLPREWPTARGYAPWVEEIWANYLSNAMKYGGEPPLIELGGDTNGNGMCRFWIRDNGRGLTAEEQQRVFTPFTRLNQVKVEGHGLGLSVVHRIVEKLGGKVDVISFPGKGSEFSFTLPADKEQARTGD